VIPSSSYNFTIVTLTPPTLLSEFNAIKKECQEIKEEVQSEIADIKLNCPSKRPIKIKLCLVQSYLVIPSSSYNFTIVTFVVTFQMLSDFTLIHIFKFTQ
jgi:hypothetical protein